MQPDPRRHAGEGDDGQQPGQPPEGSREGPAGRERDDDACRDPPRRVGSEREAEQARAQGGEAEAGEPVPARPRHEQHGEPEARDWAA